MNVILSISRRLKEIIPFRIECHFLTNNVTATKAWRPSFLWLISRGLGRWVMAPSAPPGSATVVA